MNTIIILSAFKGTKNQFVKAIILTLLIDSLVVITCVTI
jgi:hypothetical protein